MICTDILHEKEWKEEQYIKLSKINKTLEPVENINRLAQYYTLSNYNRVKIYIDRLSERKDKKTKGISLTKEEKLKLLKTYENLIVGKTDCNKFGLMLIKLMHRK